ncbi:MAG: JmjC domain-containing protein, partial [Spirillospora sp.]
MADLETPIDDADPVWAQLFADPAEVRRLDWGRTFARFKAGAAVRALVTLPRVEDWLRHGNLRYPQFSISNGGQAVPPTAYTRTVVFGTHQATGLADPERVAARVRSGDTLVFTMPELWDGPLRAFSRELGRALAADVRTYAYLTAPGEYGSRPHRDESELFVVQAAGSKRWELYDVPEGDDWSIGPIADPGEPTEVLELNAGEALHLPLGIGHRARAGAAGSLHLTISAAVPAFREVVRAWAAEVAGALPRNARLP